MNYQQPHGQPWDDAPSYNPQAYGRGAVQPAQYQPAYQQQAPPGYPVQQPSAPAAKRYGLRGAEPFWYVLGCIAMGAAYLAKIPVKKAATEILSELLLDGQGPSRSYSLGAAESFWYVLMCIPLGGAYFAKVSAKKALWEAVSLVQSGPGDYAAAIGRALGHASPRQPF
jgi:hypothetical protein